MFNRDSFYDKLKSMMDIEMDHKRKRLDILGIPVDRVSMDEALAVFERLLDAERSSFIVTPNSEIIMKASSDPKLANLIENADLVIPDGIGLVYASRLLKQPLKERVTGIDFTQEALRIVAARGKRVFFLGGKPGVAQAAAEKKMVEISGLNVVGVVDGYFKEEDELTIVSRINDSGADFLCVALGSPKQELFIERNRTNLKPCVSIGIGGTLDVWAGVLERAPAFYQKYGLEWLYRVKQEPARIKRLKALPTFLLCVIFNKK